MYAYIEIYMIDLRYPALLNVCETFVFQNMQKLFSCLSVQTKSKYACPHIHLCDSYHCEGEDP